MVQRVNEMCSNGMSPSQAARHVAGLKEFSETPEIEAATEQQDPFERLCDDIVKAARDFDVQALEQHVQRAMFLSSAWLVYHRVFAPAMRRIGDLWHEHVISVGQEHMASEILERSTKSLLRLVTPPRTKHPIVLACYADELHTLPLYGVAFELARLQVSPLILGARTPATAIESVVSSLQPIAIALSATVTPAPSRAAELARTYGEAMPDTPWIVGGPGAEAMRSEIEAAGGTVGGYPKLRSLVIEARRKRGTP